MISAARRRCVQLHDYKSNTMLLITLNDDSSSSSSSRHNGSARDGNTSSSDSAAHESDADDSEVEHSEESDFDPSEVSDDEDDDRRDVLTRLETEHSSDVITSALELSKRSSLTPEDLHDVMIALDAAVDKLDTKPLPSPLDPGVRTEVHHAMAQFFARKGSSFRERSIKHCNRGLLLLHGRHRSFPRLSAELHLLKANLMLGDRSRRKMSDIFEHIRSARVALAISQPPFPPDAQFELYMTTGFAHSVCTANPICEHLVAGYDAYLSAIELVRLSPDYSTTLWMHLVCVAAQLAVRFLRHRRIAQSDPLSPCYSSQTAACRLASGNSLLLLSNNFTDHFGESDAAASRPHVRRIHADQVLNMVDDVKRRLIDMMDSIGGNGDYELEQRLSVAHECIGRCYIERSYGAGGRRGDKLVADDLKKACLALQKALWSCEWSDDYAGQRYVTLSELLEGSKQRLQVIEERIKTGHRNFGGIGLANGRGGSEHIVDDEDDEEEEVFVEEWDDSYWKEIEAVNSGNSSSSAPPEMNRGGGSIGLDGEDSEKEAGCCLVGDEDTIATSGWQKDSQAGDEKEAEGSICSGSTEKLCHVDARRDTTLQY